ncbi:putative sorE [Burkholderia thailandensis E444]|nr:putative sorE [Burkholderia thailandensis E444]
MVRAPARAARRVAVARDAAVPAGRRLCRDRRRGRSRPRVDRARDPRMRRASRVDRTPPARRADRCALRRAGRVRPAPVVPERRRERRRQPARRARRGARAFRPDRRRRAHGDRAAGRRPRAARRSAVQRGAERAGRDDREPRARVRRRFSRLHPVLLVTAKRVRRGGPEQLRGGLHVPRRVRRLVAHAAPMRGQGRELGLLGANGGRRIRAVSQADGRARHRVDRAGGGDGCRRCAARRARRSGRLSEDDRARRGAHARARARRAHRAAYERARRQAAAAHRRNGRERGMERRARGARSRDRTPAVRGARRAARIRRTRRSGRRRARQRRDRKRCARQALVGRAHVRARIVRHRRRAALGPHRPRVSALARACAGADRATRPPRPGTAARAASPKRRRRWTRRAPNGRMRARSSIERRCSTRTSRSPTRRSTRCPRSCKAACPRRRSCSRTAT